MCAGTWWPPHVARPSRPSSWAAARAQAPGARWCRSAVIGDEPKVLSRVAARLRPPVQRSATTTTVSSSLCPLFISHALGRPTHSPPMDELIFQVLLSRLLFLLLLLLSINVRVFFSASALSIHARRERPQKRGPTHWERDTLGVRSLVATSFIANNSGSGRGVQVRAFVFINLVVFLVFRFVMYFRRGT